MAAKFVSNFASDGAVLGHTVSDKLGFFGVTPIVRPTVSASATNSATTITQLNLLITALGNLGLITPAA
jgi:hypothetical protein